MVPIWNCGVDEDVVDFAFMDGVEGIYHGYNVISGKGVHTLFLVYINCSYSKVNDYLHVSYFTVNNHYYFAPQHLYFSHIAHSLNYSVFTEFEDLRHVFNLLMHTGKQFQSVRKYAQMYMLQDTWRYLVRTLDDGVVGGGKLVVLRKSRVEYFRWFLSKLMQDRKRFRGKLEMLMVEGTHVVVLM